MQVLVIEDSEVDFLLIEHALDGKFEIQRRSSLGGGLELAARETFDLLILDLTVDDSQGFETFEKAHKALPRIPILVLSGLDDDELALRAMAIGAQDYIPKSRLLNYPLDRAARYAIERRRSENIARSTEQRYRNLLDNLPTPACTCDPQGLLTYFNKKAVEMWGRTPKLNDPEYRFTGAFKLFGLDGNEIPRDQALLAKVLATKQGFNGYETQIERPDGQRRTVLSHANPVLDEDGTLLGGINVFPDISKLRQTERELRESERFARATVDSLAALIAILDENGKILAINSAWRRFAQDNGMQSDGYGLGTNYLTVCERTTGECSESARAVAAGIRSVLSGEKDDFNLEYACHSPDEQRWFMVRARPFEGDGPRRVVISHEDVTAQKTAERLAGEQLSLREAVAGMEHVLGVVGHELRTPLAALRAVSEFLTTKDALQTPEAEGFLHQISREVCRMSDTVNNILEAARLNSGRARWTWSQVDLESVIVQAIESIQPLVEKQGIKISGRVDESAGWMNGDGEAIRRLLVNLLSNALKHTTEGEIEVVSRRVSDAHGHWIELVVRDTGCGIPPEITARLGEAFALNSGVVGSNCIGGTGLGLAICKGIAAAHGGEIVFQSVQGKGTTVTARLGSDLQAASVGDTVHTDDLRNQAA